MSQFPVNEGLLETLDALDLSLDGERVAKLSRYCELIVEWNHQVNLTGAKTAIQFAQGPLFDALTLTCVLAEDATLLDVGSGGGLPGIPAAILMGKSLAVTLLEPRKKRVVFLEQAATTLDLDLHIVCGRLEDLAPENHRNAVAQAVWPPDKWLKRAKQLLPAGGAAYVLSSKPLESKDLRAGVSVEKQRRLLRPLDQAPRFATRVRL